jgi:brefeldin A-inhibited guanine nucleotide-exchange protein
LGFASNWIPLYNLDDAKASGGTFINASTISPSELWVPLSLALDVRLNPKVRELALDVTQKLIALGLLFGEKDDVLVPSSPAIEAALGSPSNSPAVEPSGVNVHSSDNRSGGATQEDAGIEGNTPTDTSQEASSPANPLDALDVTPDPAQTFMEDVISTCILSFSPLSHGVGAEEALHIQVLKVILTASTLAHVQVHNLALLKSLQTCFNFYLYSRNKNVVTTARASLTQILSFVVSRTSSPSTAQSSRDALISVRALCKLASKSFNERESASISNSDQSLSVRCRCLALELLLSFINQMLQLKSPIASEIIQKQADDLTMVISRNSTAVQPALFESSLAVFNVILQNYRHIFKAQIPLLLCDVYFPVLAGSAASSQKQLILQAFAYYCNQPQLIVDLYVNFDCDLTMPSCLEEFISHCCSSYSAFPQLSVSCVDGILKSLILWMNQASCANNLASSPGPSPVSPELLEESFSSPFGERARMLSTNNLGSIAAQAADETVIVRKQHAKHGLELFSQNPKKGVEYLIAYDVVSKDDPTSLAQFLHANNTNKIKLGEFLGELENISRMHAYIDTMDFRGLQFVDALRQFLGNFKLPGEAQKIDRFMEKFSDKYCGDNPNVFKNADTAYALAFSVIMLNTDLHSKQIKKRMSKEDFIKNNRRITDSDVLSDEYFSNIFEEVHHISFTKEYLHLILPIETIFLLTKGLLTLCRLKIAKSSWREKLGKCAKMKEIEMRSSMVKIS